MNELEIRTYINKLIAESETKLENVYARMLKETLLEIQRMYTKYKKQGELSYTDLNKYNRLHNIFDRISETLTEEYRVAVQELTAMRKTVYVETYLREAYLFEVFSSIEMGFQIPSVGVIESALSNPIEHLRLPKTMKKHRDQIAYDLQILITQALLRGDSYWDLAAEIEKKFGFFANKARAVARTEAGRAQSIATEKAMEHASKFVKMTKMWASSLDFRVRTAHRTLDGQQADKEGYFHYRSLKAKGPHMWNRADMDINCRCIVLHLVNGMMPSVRRGRNFKDPEYQKKFKAAVEKYMDGEGLTLAQAVNKANKRIVPPSVEYDGFISYNDWHKKMTA